MLYLTLAAILIGSCAIETSATKLLVTSTSDNTAKDVSVREVTPITKGRVGWKVSYLTMMAEFPNLKFDIELSEQLKATFDGKPLKHLAIAVNMWVRKIPDTVPRNVVATYTDDPFKYGLYHNDGKIEDSDFYFEADKE